MRCHARILDEKPEQRRGARKTLPRPKYVLVLDTETTTDARQTLNLGAYQFCEADSNGEFVCRMNILLTAAIAFGTVIKAFWQCRHRAAFWAELCVLLTAHFLILQRLRWTTGGYFWLPIVVGLPEIFVVFMLLSITLRVTPPPPQK